ncbi:MULTISPECIES: hypothetical protein [Streptomyces]|uniref:Peptidase inhibitor family I36 n=1 Tax=Streptomyces sviceus (strain ATCC 29083 / DSM 924 / JCM 4929 / NBRC 13980 / NCIMB 11184 / NRRL 5439 / UC 5370) TaxID=463191 RepID=B5HLK9_STRX2|nr:MULTISPECIES: hypothetical protein [Streptomyces]EDY53714.1 conserved hypothetical protein [Streptomyces sviceus ATCC 29083]MYT06674.1 hypothetical protein [Streptomyces sp. SID5470]
MGKSRVFGTILGTAALIAGAGVLNAAPASAAVTGTCYTDRPCIWLYYNSAYEGSHILIGGGSISNLDGYTYPYAGAGKGLPVKNNAASAKMRADDSFYPSSMTVFYYSGYGGPCDRFMSSELGIKEGPKLVRTYNENASVKQVLGTYQANHPSNCFNW